MAILPKVLIFACTITFAKPMTEFLNAGGKAIADDLPEHFAVDAEFCPMQVVFCRFFRQLYQAQNDANGL